MCGWGSNRFCTGASDLDVEYRLCVIDTRTAAKERRPISVCRGRRRGPRSPPSIGMDPPPRGANSRDDDFGRPAAPIRGRDGRGSRAMQKTSGEYEQLVGLDAVARKIRVGIRLPRVLAPPRSATFGRRFEVERTRAAHRKMRPPQQERHESREQHAGRVRRLAREATNVLKSVRAGVAGPRNRKDRLRGRSASKQRIQGQSPSWGVDDSRDKEIGAVF